MNKKFFFAGFLFLIIVVFSLNYTNSVKSNVLNFSNGFKSNFIFFTDSVKFKIQSLFDQQKKIYELELKVKTLEPAASLSVAYAAKLNSFLKDANLSNYNPKVYLTRVLSYTKMQNPNKLWLEFEKFEKEKVYGLLYQGFSAGIVKEQSERAMAVLQTDEDCVYSVYLGDDKIPGVLFGSAPFVSVKYIPLYANVKVGDRVITSGFDEIFFEGVGVGVVAGLESDDIYKTAIVKPYANIKKPDFFYVIDAK